MSVTVDVGMYGYVLPYEGYLKEERKRGKEGGKERVRAGGREGGSKGRGREEEDSIRIPFFKSL